MKLRRKPLAEPQIQLRDLDADPKIKNEVLRIVRAALEGHNHKIGATGRALVLGRGVMSGFLNAVVDHDDSVVLAKLTVDKIMDLLSHYISGDLGHE